MAQELDDYLQSHPPKGFRPVPHYFAQGDFVTYFFRNEPAYAKRVDDLLTVFLSFETHQLVGCKIKGVKHILQSAGDFGVSLDDGAIRLGLFFFIGASMAKDEGQRQRYEELRQIARDARLDKRELMLAT